MRGLKLVILGLFVCGVFVSPAAAQTSLDKVFKSIQDMGGKATTDTSGSQVAQGLKEALRVGTEQAVTATSQTDGFFGNSLIKIGIPEKFQSVEKGLRLAGYGAKVDEFVLSMNRAAETAAPQAKKIFINAITAMSFTDASQILQGGDTAATDFFKSKTSDDLYTSFRPVVDRTMAQVGTVQTYNTLLAQAEKLPFVKGQNLDIGHYVTNKALDGLFVMVAKEEQDIRQNPTARITPLLQKVFGP